VLTSADEVVLVDLTPEALIARLRAGKVYPAERVPAALNNFFRVENLAALREVVLRQTAEEVESKRSMPAGELLGTREELLADDAPQAVAERVLALVTPRPRSQRLVRRAWRSAQRLGAELDAAWIREPGVEPTAEERVQLAALRRLAVILGAHFVEEEGTDFVDTVRRVVIERGSTYVIVGTPNESRWREISRGSLLSRMVRELPGVDIRVVADRSRREELVR
jgi:two-component system sensor histidine kinase KdpD